MSHKKIKTAFTTLGVMVILAACNLPSTTTEATEVPPTATETAPQATEASVPPTEIAAIQHETIPVGLPDLHSGQAGDFDSSAVLENNTSIGGDRFTYGQFERPFNANTMDIYFSQLDIVDTFVSEDETWIFGAMRIKAPDASNALSGKYAIELDTNLDGKGDWLIMASNPVSTDWGVAGVQIYEDANNDVGGQLPTLTDDGNAGAGDGFESLVFDAGDGDDPDSAWVRISSSESNSVEIAVKKSVLGNPQKYLINMWAGTSLLDPALFDLNDHFTHEQAGAADIGLEYYYPIKEVYEIDSSCRMAVGFQATGQEPGLCEVLIPISQPGAPPPPSGGGCTLTANSCPTGFDAAQCCCTAVTFVGCLP